MDQNVTEITFLSPKETAARVGLSRMTMWRKATNPDDDFPVPYQLSEGRVGYRADEIETWMRARPRVRYAAGVAEALANRNELPVSESIPEIPAREVVS